MAYAEVHVDVQADESVILSGPDVERTLGPIERGRASEILQQMADRLHRPLVVMTTAGTQRYRDVITPSGHGSTLPVGTPLTVATAEDEPAAEASPGNTVTSRSSGEQQSPKGTPPPSSQSQSQTRMRRGLIVASGVTTICVGAVTVLLAATTPHGVEAPEHGDTAAAENVDLFAAGIAPYGWSQRVVWTAESDRAVEPVVTPSGRVAFVSTSGDVVVADPSNGEVVWSHAAGVVAPQLFTATVAGADVVAWHAGDAIRVWSERSGDLEEVPDSADLVLSVGGDALLMTDQGGAEPRVLTRSGWVAATIPRGSVSMGVLDGQVISATGRPPLWLSPVTGGDPVPIPLEHAEGSVVRRWVGIAGGTVTVVWDEPGLPDPTRLVRLAVHRVATGEVLTSIKVPWGRVENAALTAAGGAEPTSVAVGPVVLPIGGKREPVLDGDVTWKYHVDGRVYGWAISGAPMRFNRKGTITKLPTGSYVPLGVGRGDTVIVRDEDVILGLEKKPAATPSATPGKANR